MTTQETQPQMPNISMEDLALDKGRFFKEIIYVQANMLVKHVFKFKDNIVDDAEVGSTIKMEPVDGDVPAQIMFDASGVTLTYYNGELDKLLKEFIAVDPENRIAEVTKAIRKAVDTLFGEIGIADKHVKLALCGDENPLDIPWIFAANFECLVMKTEDTEELWLENFTPVTAAYLAGEEALVELLGLDTGLLDLLKPVEGQN